MIGYLVIYGGGGVGLATIIWAIAALRHRAFALRVEPVPVSPPDGASIAYPFLMLASNPSPDTTPTGA